MYCRKCGEEIKSDDLFCVSCSTKNTLEATFLEIDKSKGNSKNISQPWYRTGWVWFWLILFWPIGLYGLIKRADPKHQKWWWIGFTVLFIVAVLNKKPNNTTRNAASSVNSGSVYDFAIEDRYRHLMATISDEQAFSLAGLINHHGYKCDTISYVSRFFNAEENYGYNVSCNHSLYEYTVKYIDGNLQIKVK